MAGLKLLLRHTHLPIGRKGRGFSKCIPQNDRCATLIIWRCKLGVPNLKVNLTWRMNQRGLASHHRLTTRALSVTAGVWPAKVDSCGPPRRSPTSLWGDKGGIEMDCWAVHFGPRASSGRPSNSCTSTADEFRYRSHDAAHDVSVTNTSGKRVKVTYAAYPIDVAPFIVSAPSHEARDASGCR